ncbi:unnamed protein product [Symbiodinium natans]|uniref:Uncharacterized protein n=1 Tax=Symbiodinium natans TaxID=878477 RepID=A0A812HKH2_9DINO|nr:unnamed protein product [Symbiodinium natans]
MAVRILCHILVLLLPLLVDGGCSQVTNFSFVNGCEADVILKDWNVVVPAKMSYQVSELRSSGLQRISWRYVDGPWDTDFIELNGDWKGVGTPFCGHPNFATWAGFSMSSRYEALLPGEETFACADPGAELTFSRVSCPSMQTSRYLCDFFATQDSIRSCGSKVAIYMQERSWAINPDGSRVRAYNATQNVVNYWCAPESPDWRGWGVGSFIDCTRHETPIHFRVTTCIPE